VLSSVYWQVACISVLPSTCNCLRAACSARNDACNLEQCHNDRYQALMGAGQFASHHATHNLQDNLNNHLIQIGTGEGKSVALGITAVIFSLLGFSVDVVCYSRYQALFSL
jgi:hypothetical protein